MPKLNSKQTNKQINKQTNNNSHLREYLISLLKPSSRSVADTARTTEPFGVSSGISIV